MSSTQNLEEDVNLVRQALQIFRNLTQMLFEHPETLQQVLLSLVEDEDEGRNFLEMSEITQRGLDLSGLTPSAIATIIETMCRRNWKLQAEVIMGLEPRTRRATAAQLSEETRVTVLKVMFTLQMLAEIEFTYDGEFLPELYIMAGEWPDQFPHRLRTCSACGQVYRPFDGIEVVDDTFENSRHQNRICA